MRSRAKKSTGKIILVIIELLAVIGFVALMLNYKTILAYATHQDAQVNQVTTGLNEEEIKKLQENN